MSKKKAQKIFLAVFRIFARAFILDLPILAVLLLLAVFHRITYSGAWGIFISVFSVTLVITALAFHETEKFIVYLRSLAQDDNTETPRFHKGIFGSFRLIDAFLSVKNLWSQQTLSDARILDNLPDPLLMTNNQNQIVFANQSACHFFGDVLHKSVTQIFNDEIFVRSFDKIIQTQSTREWFEFQYEDSQMYAFQVRIERLPAPAKNGATIVIVLHDITQLKLFKQQQADFFANASHELKTPLTIISGFIETLQGPAKDDVVAQEKFLNLMAEQTKRMTQLVQDLLELSKLQMGQKNQQTDVILLNEILKGVIEDLSLKAKQYQKEIKLKLIHDIPRIKGNQNQLVQVFQNLIDNAIKYGAPQSTITVSAKLCNGFPQKSDKYLTDMRQVVMVGVHNTGNPIAPHNINRLFERFYRVDTVRTKSIEGTGLGLGIAQQIVMEHDGLIDIHSSPTRGTTFSVYLPIDL
ncbi:MAG: PAS domain-containing protein [Alphaproteobacteria bacterium]|nr:PAS domain-containing protein [Alphaproteobacteria bacterium]